MDKKNTTLDNALEKWKSLPEEERQKHFELCKPFARKWLEKTKEKRIIVEYSITLLFLLLAILVMSADPLFIRVLSLPVFILTWGLFINIEKCSKYGADLLEGIIAMQVLREEGEAKTS